MRVDVVNALRSAPRKTEDEERGVARMGKRLSFPLFPSSPFFLGRSPEL